MVSPTYSRGCQQEWTSSSTQIPENVKNAYHQQDNQSCENKVAKLVDNLKSFAKRCDSILTDLNSAQTTEFFDSMTSNQSLFGSYISNSSYHQNYQVANRLDRLKHSALDINMDIKQLKQNYGLHMGKLNTNFHGENIRQAENAEHSFWGDWFTGGNYSSMGSCNTMQKLSSATHKVEKVRDQALKCLRDLRKH